MININVRISSNGKKGITNCNVKATADDKVDSYEHFIADDLLEVIDNELQDIYDYLENKGEKE